MARKRKRPDRPRRPLRDPALGLGIPWPLRNGWPGVSKRAEGSVQHAVRRGWHPPLGALGRLLGHLWSRPEDKLPALAVHIRLARAGRPLTRRARRRPVSCW